MINTKYFNDVNIGKQDFISVKTNLKSLYSKSNKWLDKVIFNKVLNPIFRYKHFADELIKPKSDINLPYKTRLKIYNNVYKARQYGHIYFVGEETYELIQRLVFSIQNESDTLTNIIGITFNGLLALHIRYNRERVKNILEYPRFKK